MAAFIRAGRRLLEQGGVYFVRAGRRLLEQGGVYYEQGGVY